MWEDLSLYLPVIEKIAKKWYYRINKDISSGFERMKNSEILSECFIGYVETQKYVNERPLTETEVVPFLTSVCNHRMIDYFRKQKQGKTVDMEISRMAITVDSSQFLSIYWELKRRQAHRLMSADANLIMNIVLDEEETLLAAHNERKQFQGYSTDLSVFDLVYLMKQRGWSRGRVYRASAEIRDFVTNL